MEKVSAKVFFTVLWSGVCQAVVCFGKLFGYKRGDSFSKVVWRVFAVSGTIVMAFFASMIIWAGGKEIYNHCIRNPHSGGAYCFWCDFVSRDVSFHNTEDGKGYIYNSCSGEKTLKHIAWIAMPMGKDSLVCFSNGEKRGYFAKNTGKVVIEPKYNHAWIFSEGLASVEENGYIKFIDATGKVVIDKKMAYIPDMDGYVFHGGYCVVNTDDGEQYGLMDRTGNIVLPTEYSFIYPTNNFKMWVVRKDEKMAVFDADLKPVIPMMECSICINNGTIDVTMPDHTMRKYDMQGVLINDFYISSVRTLEYEKDEILYRRETHDEEGNEYDVPVAVAYHPLATARLRAYAVGGGYMGLMTADGHLVTMPLYEDIDAIGSDLYLCTSTNYDKVVVNGKGEIVK